MIIQLCGLSGSGKTTLAIGVQKLLEDLGQPTEIIDGDEYRKLICSDLGFSAEDRKLNLRRLAFVAGKLSKYDVIAIICAINPYDDVRMEISQNYLNVKTVFVDCSITELFQRDTKGLYRRSKLATGHPEKIVNLSGINDPFEPPVNPDLLLRTDLETISESTGKFYRFIKDCLIQKNYV